MRTYTESLPIHQPVRVSDLVLVEVQSEDLGSGGTMTDYVAVLRPEPDVGHQRPGLCSESMAFARISLNSNLDSALHSVRVSGGGISAGCLPLDDVPPDFNGEDVVCVVAMAIHHSFQGYECILIAGERILCDGSGHPLRILQILSAEVVHCPIGRLPGGGIPLRP